MNDMLVSCEGGVPSGLVPSVHLPEPGRGSTPTESQGYLLIPLLSDGSLESRDANVCLYCNDAPLFTHLYAEFLARTVYSMLRMVQRRDYVVYLTQSYPALSRTELGLDALWETRVPSVLAGVSAVWCRDLAGTVRESTYVRGPSTTATSDCVAWIAAPKEDRETVPGDQAPAGHPAGSGGPGDLEEAAMRALRTAAYRRELADVDARRAIAQAARLQISQRKIGDAVGRSQPDVGRTIKRLSDRPELVQVSPREVALRRAVGELDAAAMMDGLKAIDYSNGAVDPSPAGNGYVRGPWDDVRMLRRQQLISDAEWREIFEHVHGPAETGTGEDPLGAATDEETK